MTSLWILERAVLDAIGLDIRGHLSAPPLPFGWRPSALVRYIDDDLRHSLDRDGIRDSVHTSVAHADTRVTPTTEGAPGGLELVD
eukprot:16213668-Heterocapsa_arctica.AAC.1